MFWLFSCVEVDEKDSDDLEVSTNSIQPQMPAKPMVRWWWFATMIEKEDLKSQLDWAKTHDFGGVEISWVYPLYRYNSIYTKHHGKTYKRDTTAQAWLSEEWTEMVTYAKRYADSIGLQCDFTLGSAWPSAVPHVSNSYSTQIYGDSAFRQAVTFSWIYPDSMFVINHLDSHAFQYFSGPIIDAIKTAFEGSRSSLFIDSWEIKLNAEYKIWTNGFEKRFFELFAYDIIPFIDYGLDSFPDVRYDYMKLLNSYILEGFYTPFANLANDQGVISRAQCLASPTDVMSAYARIDIPESEAMLNNPNYSRIVSSSAALTSKPLVSCETFTCPYGFPGTHMREEQVADLKMIVDALLANGINMFVYHGMPYNTINGDTNDFFATTYFGPGSTLEKELIGLNQYVENITTHMRKGTTYSDVAIYIPYEDALMKGAYPKEQQRAWVWGQYEMRHISIPEEIEGHHPLWINADFLEKAVVEDNKMKVGDAIFSSLYIDVSYMDIAALEQILNLSKKGVSVCLKKDPQQAGKIKDDRFKTILQQLKKVENVVTDFNQLNHSRPLIKAKELPAYWCRKDEENNLYLFLAQQQSKALEYPLYSGQSYDRKVDTLLLEINHNEHIVPIELFFEPYQSKLLKISPKGKVKELDIGYYPPDPVIRPIERQRIAF